MAASSVASRSTSRRRYDVTAIERLDDAIAAGGSLIRAGTVSFPSGRIIAADPYFATNAQPLQRRVPPGEYPLELGRVDIDPFGWRTAFARLRLRPDVEVTRFEPATSGSGGFDAYPVDSGLGSFMDERARDDFVAAVERYESAPDRDYHFDVLIPELRRSAPEPDLPGVWAIHQPPGAHSQVAVFQAGFGDGAYPSYWGLDAAGEPATLTTDFGLVGPDG